MIRWQHVKSDSSHPVEPHHASTGKWVCYKCRAPIGDEGKAIDTSLKGLHHLLGGPLFTDPDQPGLETEGS